MVVFSEEPAPAHDTVDNDKASAGHCLVDELGGCVEISALKWVTSGLICLVDKLGR